MEALKVCCKRRGKSSSTVNGGSQNSAKRSLLVEEMLSSGRELLQFSSTISAQECDLIREQHGIIVEGDEIPPPITNFEDMRFPEPILKKLIAKGITPIQVQGLPVILSGRDMVGICFSGPEKTLVYALPLVMLALQQEIKMPIAPGEGPLGLVICPSRETAMMAYGVLEELLKTISTVNGFPKLRSLLCIDGVDVRLQLQVVEKGVHIVVAAPGRLKELLVTKKMNLDKCRYITFDEIDWLFYMSLEDDMREILNQFKVQRQTLFFCRTMFTELKEFTRNASVMPITVDVLERKKGVETPRQNFYEVVDSLRKTPPPVLILCGEQTDVDYLYKCFLVEFGGGVGAIHAGKSEKQIQYAITSFKAGKHATLISTEAASKGLDFPDIQHVIYYDMPAEIENGLHRRGRFATTFINKFIPKKTDYLYMKNLFQSKPRIKTSED